jgi:hypothetical protein
MTHKSKETDQYLRQLYSYFWRVSLDYGCIIICVVVLDICLCVYVHIQNDTEGAAVFSMLPMYKHNQDTDSLRQTDPLQYNSSTSQVK